ncbi:hypothetical protein BRD17_00835 [Halobacteriales archaeon SW_7_68_16]|nr:MAG: hypothetical protein BRD17_00835 [Halobacteriales archaeon SW_7_68_16]
MRAPTAGRRATPTVLRYGSRGSDRAERADPWTLAGRMKAMGKRRWPDDVARGEEWRAAARSFD